MRNGGARGPGVQVSHTQSRSLCEPLLSLPNWFQGGPAAPEEIKARQAGAGVGSWKPDRSVVKPSGSEITQKMHAFG